MAPYQYDSSRNLYAPSIAELLARRGDIAARQAEAVGLANARAADASGNIWGRAFDTIGQTVAAVPQQMQAAKRQAQADEMARRQAADVDALDTAFANGVDRDSVLNALPGHLRPTVSKQFAEADKSALEVRDLKDKAAVAERDYLGSLAAGVKPFLDGEDGGLGAAMVALRHAKEQGYEQADQIWQRIKANPEQLPQIVDQMMQSSPKQVELLTSRQTADARTRGAATAATRLELETPKIEADTRKAVAEVEGTLPMTPAQKASNDIAVANLGVSRARLSLEQQKAAAAQSDVTELTPEGLDAAALNYAKTGQLPPLGMGDKQTRKQIINRAAQMTPGLDLASNRADFEANKATLTKLQQQRDAIGAFEQTAQKNIDVFLEQAKKVVDTGSPIANTLVRQVTGKVLGSPDQAAFDAARQVAINEIAKITSNPNLSGTLSDSARHEVEAFNPQSATLAQSVKVMRLLKQDMQNRTTALDEQIAGIRGRIGTAPGDGGAKEGDTKPIPGFPGTEQTYRNGKWIRTK